MLLWEYSIDEFNVKVHDTILDGAFREQWDQLSAPDSALQSDYLSALERAEALDLSFRYLLILKENKVVGRVYFQLMKFGHYNLSVSGNNVWQKLASILVRFFPFRIVICGNLFAVDFPPLDSPFGKISETQMLEIILAFASKEKHDVLVLKDMPDNFIPDVVKSYRLSIFGTDLTMKLKIRPTWNTYQDYEKALTHKYGQRARKIRRAGSVLVRKPFDYNLLTIHQKEITKLFQEICSKQTIRMGIVDAKYFIELFQNCGSRFHMTGYFLDNKLVAFATMLDHKDTLELHYIGMDYAYNKTHNLYFNILFDGVEQAILKNKNELELGRTAREAKAVIGCQPVYFNDYILIRNRITRWSVSVIQEYFQNKMGESWKNRHPFKDSEPASKI